MHVPILFQNPLVLLRSIGYWDEACDWLGRVLICQRGATVESLYTKPHMRDDGNGTTERLMLENVYLSLHIHLRLQQLSAFQNSNWKTGKRK